MDNIQKQSELLHSISNKIKDGEYKMLMENLAEIKKQKIPQFVSFISVKGVTNIKGVMMSVVNGEEEAEPYSEKISSSGGMTEFSTDYGEEMRNIRVTTELKVEQMVRKVVDKDAPEFTEHTLRSCAYIPTELYEELKNDGFVRRMNCDYTDEEILIYLGDFSIEN
jgi:hypothetical protein